MSERLASVRRLTVHDHDTAASRMTYVYPVVSRRAGGVSVGVNLNPNHACNWRCTYCQVEDLHFGNGPEIDVALLEAELTEMLGAIVEGDALERWAPPEARRLTDVAFSGDGESTTSPQLVEAMNVVRRVLDSLHLTGKIKVILITNGSMMRKPRTHEALGLLAAMNGEVWFKLDRATDLGMAALNNAHGRIEEHIEGLRIAARLCPTWIQTCVVATSGEILSDEDEAAYLDRVERLVIEGVPLRGVHLYTLARPSRQPEAPALAPASRAWMDAFAAQIRARGLAVNVVG